MIDDELFELALREDLGSAGDVSSSAIFTDQVANAKLVCKSGGILSGSGLIAAVLKRFDPAASVDLLVRDGQHMAPAALIASISAKIAAILSAERLFLNFLGLLSGIATETGKLVELLKNLDSTMQILDTRKTIPGLRLASKQAVKDGGGSNHRMGLYDMVMLKDNHIDAAGGIREAVNAVRQKWGKTYRIEVECRNLEDVKQALALDVDIIMLDNMSPELCKQALQIRRLGAWTTPFEISGNLSAQTLPAYAQLGVEYASIGKITHSVPSVDFSLRIDREGQR